ncbi:acetylglutamate kinase [Thalassotalea sp. LPB0316]|uniref:acetylglutamate kinase n=1 Tax=Thalassotalea sp. LPB0316 TaxID=2769490 RepID=UPI00186673E4|nr:acetylglutamate kinase [Thalassotalea sp. LPB0316]QOL26546.1 acetylglutamate kinase [Thalassotalea sp. LPB0316]
MKQPLVIKVGGAILTNEQALAALFQVIKQAKDQQIVLVHGGGYVVDNMLCQAGYSTKKIDGLRVTPKKQIPTITGALAGYVNKTLVAKASQQALVAVGLSLADGQMTRCQLANPKLEAVGQVSAHSSQLLDTLLKSGCLPIISSIGALDDGQLVNVNADDAAVVICQLLNAQLLLLTDVNGVKGADGQYLSALTQGQANQLIEQGIIAGGMTAKVHAAFAAANHLRRSIAVASWQSPEQILSLVAGQAVGTQIQPNC